MKLKSMAKKKIGGKNKSVQSHSEDKVTKDEDGVKGNLAKDKKAKSNLASEVTRRYSTRRGSTLDEKDNTETSGTKKIVKNATKGKRKLEEEHSEMVKTPAKRRKVDQEVAEAFVASNEKSSYCFREKRAVPCFRKVDLSDSEFRGVVGKRVKVFRSYSRKWCAGRIGSYNGKKKQHKVVYDDGKIGELDMKTERFELELKHGEVYTFKEGSSAGKGKSVLVEDDETKENQSKLKKENISSVSKQRFSKAEKGKATATDMNKVGKASLKVRDTGSAEEIIKERRSKSQKKGSANDVKAEHVASHKTASNAKTVSRKTKKARDETKVEGRKNPVRQTRANVITR